MSKRILILGAGYAQIDAINYCKDRGYYVCGCSYTNTDSGIPLLDDFEQVDIKDIDGITALAEGRQVDLIYSVGSDLAIPSIMAASERLGLPHFISSETAENCHSKHLMRQCLGPGFAGNADFIVAQTPDQALAFNHFPAMMKPVDSQGQRGCFRVDSPADIEANFEKSLDYSITGKVIVESYIEGPEISVNAYFQDGQMRLAVISDRMSFDEFPGGIIRAHRIPSQIISKDCEAEVLDLVRRSSAALGITDGPCYDQIKLNRDGHPVILEVAPRLDGCHMWDLIRHWCGADLLDACFTQLLTSQPVLCNPVSFPDEPYDLVFNCRETGAVFDRADYDTQGAETVVWYYETGDIVGRVNGYMEKGGYMIRKSSYSKQ